MAQIDAFFRLMRDQGASELHMVAGQHPFLRIRGKMEQVKYRVLENDELKDWLDEICPKPKIKLFEEIGETDFDYQLRGVIRCRASIRRQEHGIGAVFHEIRQGETDGAN